MTAWSFLRSSFGLCLWYRKPQWHNWAHTRLMNAQWVKCEDSLYPFSCLHSMLSLFSSMSLVESPFCFLMFGSSCWATVAPRQLRVFTELGIMDKAINSCIYYTLVGLLIFFIVYNPHFIRSDTPISQTHKRTCVRVCRRARRGLVIKISVLACSLNA